MLSLEPFLGSFNRHTVTAIILLLSSHMVCRGNRKKYSYGHIKIKEAEAELCVTFYLCILSAFIINLAEYHRNSTSIFPPPPPEFPLVLFLGSDLPNMKNCTVGIRSVHTWEVEHYSLVMFSTIQFLECSATKIWDRCHMFILP